MLRPATPISVVLLASFALALLALLSPPIIPALPLAQFAGVTYGVFGKCSGNKCSPASIGYDAVDGTQSSDWKFPNAARRTLPTLLILHPVAAFLALACFVMAAAAHFHTASHSAWYLLALFILTIVTLLVCLAAFAIDIALFAPNMALGTWLMLAAVIALLVSSIASCIMRSMMLGRKQRRRALAENPEMSGGSHYRREAAIKATTSDARAIEPTIPLVSGANQSNTESMPKFAALEEPHSRDDTVSDDRMPLTSRGATDVSAIIPQYNGMAQQDNAYGDPQRSVSTSRDRYAANASGPVTGGPHGLSGPPPSPLLPLPPPLPMNGGANGGPPGYDMRRTPSFEQMGATRVRGGGPTAAPRGNFRGMGGGYAPRGGQYNGAYDQRGGPDHRGVYDQRGDYGGAYDAPGRGGYGPPRAGYPQRGPSYARGRGGYRGGVAGGYPGGPPHDYYGAQDPYGMPSPAGPYGGRPPPSDGYPQRRPSTPNTGAGPQNAFSDYYYDDDDGNDLPRAESPPPLPVKSGDQVAVTAQGRPADVVAPVPETAKNSEFNYGLRDSDVDVAGMVDLQQSRQQSRQPPGQHQPHTSRNGHYGNDESTQDDGPPQAWNSTSQVNLPLQVPPPSQPAQPADSQQPPKPRARAGSAYYEDTDPRFDEPSSATFFPTMPDQPYLSSADPPPAAIDPLPPRELIPPARTMSPSGASERSNFTSISQRSINPRWNPDGPPPMPQGFMMGGGPGPGRRASQQVQQRRQDILLNDNPDFALPTRRAGPGGLGNAYPGL